MDTPEGLADALAALVAAEGAALRAVPDGPATSRPNRPTGKGWSMREELGHLLDSAVNNHARIVRAALDGRYEGPSYAQDGWIAAHGYNDRPWPDLVRSWEIHNGEIVHAVRRIPPGRLAAPCSVGGDPPVPLAFLLDDYVLHARHHLDQVLRRPVVTRYPR